MGWKLPEFSHKRTNARMPRNGWAILETAFGYTEIGLALFDIVPGMLVIRALEQRKSRLDSLELPKISPVSNAGSEQKHKIKRKPVGTAAFHVAYTPIEYRLHGEVRWYCSYILNGEVSAITAIS
jgi:hypothetical protein